MILQKQRRLNTLLTKSKTKFCFSLNFNGDNRILYANGVKFCQFKEKDFELKPYPLRF